MSMRRGITTSSVLLAWLAISLLAVCTVDSTAAFGSHVVRTFWYQGREIAEVIVPGRPPAHYRAPAVDIEAARRLRTTNILTDVPALDWSYGCSATSAAMMFGHYDRVSHSNMYAGPTSGGTFPLPSNDLWGTTVYANVTCMECPLSATHNGIDGRGSRGHVDDYWVDYGAGGPDPFSGNWAEHTYGDCTGDYMGTNQWSVANTDGSTTFYFYLSGDPLYDYTACEPANRDGCHGMKDFVGSRGYSVPVNGNYNQYIKGVGSDPAKGFTFTQYQAEIDAGRPVLIQLDGHTMLGFGYNTTGSLVYLHDTWDYSQHSMPWGTSYGGMAHLGVAVFQLDAVADTPPTVAISSPPDGDHTKNNYISISGTASDDNTVNRVQVRVNGGGWYLCTGTTSWSRGMTIALGDNLIEARAEDNIGQWSSLASIHVYRWPMNADILLVDDDAGASYETYYQNALTAAGYNYGRWQVSSQGAVPAAALTEFAGPGECVVWFTGNDFSSTLSATDQTNLANFLTVGGRLFLTGQDIGWDIHADAGNFYGNYLHASYVADDTNLYNIQGDAGSFISSPWAAPNYFVINGGTGACNQEYPSEIDALSGATLILTYEGSAAPPAAPPVAGDSRKPGASAGGRGIVSSGGAGLSFSNGTYKVVYFAFGFEAIAGVNSRNQMMGNVCAWLLNRPPTAPSVSVSPTTPLSSDTLQCSASGSTDADGDPVTYQYQWYKDGVLKPARIWPSVDSSRTSPGDHWRCEVTPTDGIENGPTVSSGTVTVNTPPPQPTVWITPPNPQSSDDLTCNATVGLDADCDTVTLSYQWYKNGVICPARVWPTVDHSRTSPGDTWRCVVTPNDGHENGTPNEDTVMIRGAPTIPTVVITPAHPINSDDLVCSASGSVDPDGAPVTYAYQWYKNGVICPARVWPTVDNSRTSPGDDWRCVVTPNNGTADGPSGEATVHVNTKPTKPTVTITPTSPTTNDDLTCNASGSTDADGDTVTYQYQWYKNGVICPARVWPTIDYSRTSPGDTWKCVVTPTDGLQNGPSASYSVIVLGSSAPMLSALSAQPTAAGAQVVFTLSADAAVTAEVMNIAGRPVQLLVAEKAMAAGLNTLTWNGRSASGLAVPSGVYLVRVRAANESGGRCEVLGTVMISR